MTVKNLTLAEIATEYREKQAAAHRFALAQRVSDWPASSQVAAALVIAALIFYSAGAAFPTFHLAAYIKALLAPIAF